LLADRPFAISIGGEFLDRMQAAQAKHKFALRIGFSCASFTQAARLVESGHAIALLPEVARPAHSTRLPFPWLAAYRREMGIAWHPRLPAIRPRASTVLDALRSIRLDAI
jgi:DNA-binding transcriptional LysR family regulator